MYNRYPAASQEVDELQAPLRLLLAQSLHDERSGSEATQVFIHGTLRNTDPHCPGKENDTVAP